MNHIMDIYQQCYRIRCFERQVEKEFENGTLRGTTHSCIGQEIIPVLILNHINRQEDYVVGTHRCHGQVLAYTGDPYRLACEMMGKKDGFVEGMGGSQHIRTEKLLVNGITGGMTVVGTGIAMGIKKRKQSGAVIAFLGDGAVNEGYVQETLNLASVYKVPIFFVCENNHYAMSTPTESYSAGSFEKRVKALDISYLSATTENISELEDRIHEGYQTVRNTRCPCFLDISTARLCGHSKSDNMEYISDEEKERNLKADPLLQMEALLSPNACKETREKVEKEIREAFSRAHTCPEKEME